MKIIKGITLTSKELSEQFRQRLKERHENPEKWRGLQFGHADLDALTGGLRKGEFVVVAGAQKRGKCLGLGTPIMMANGHIKPVEDIEIGDCLMGDDSSPRKVLSLAQGRAELYEVTLSNGDSFVCNGSHIFVLKREGVPTIKRGKRRNGEIIEISLVDYIDKTDDFKRKYRPYKAPISFPEQSIPIEPYFLGLWLGDGTSSETNITTADLEIVEYLKEHASRIGHKIVHVADTGKAATWGTRREPRDYTHDGKTLRTIMRKMGLLNNKHVPEAYLFNSEEVRLEVLAGLINSDGNRTKYRIEYNSISEQLIDDFLFLARSVGLRAKKYKQVNKGTGYVRYRVTISGNIYKIPRLLSYKYPINKTNIKEADRYSMRIRGIGTDSYYGFEINGNGRFLLGDFTVTHNTSIALSWAQNFSRQVQEDEQVLFVSLEMRHEALAGRVLANLSNIEVSRFRDYKLSHNDWNKLDGGLEKLEKLPVLWNVGASNIEGIEALVKESEGKVRVIVIDYFQLMYGDGSSGKRYEQLERISRRLKSLTLKNDLSVLAISQQNRDALKSIARQKDPNTMAGTQSLARDCDMLMVILPYIQDGDEVPHLRKLYVALSRNSTSDITFDSFFSGTYCRFGAVTEFEANEMPTQGQKGEQCEELF